MRSKVTKAERTAAKAQLEQAAGNLMRAGTEDFTAADIRADIDFIESRPELASMPRFKDVLKMLKRHLREVEERSADYRSSAAEVFAVAEAIPDPTSSKMLLLRYRDGLGWDEVAEKLGYCGDYVRGNLHHKALAAYVEAARATIEV